MTVRELWASVRQLHERPQLIEFAATGRGRILLWLAATVLLAPSTMVYSISPLLALVLVAPRWRVQILCLGSVFVLEQMLVRRGIESPAAVGAVFLLTAALLYLCYRTARAYGALPPVVQRNGQIVWHAAVCAGICSTFLFPVEPAGSVPAAVAGALRFLLPYLVWRCGYILLSGRRGSAVHSGFLDHVFYCLPVFGGTSVPYGKGHDHLTRSRAEDPQALARSALAGLKLLVLVWVWVAVRRALKVLVYGEDVHGLKAVVGGWGFDLPRVSEIIARPGSVGLPVAWLSLFLELIDATLGLAASGHMVIGCLRLFGYNVFRNTYRPLLAQSIVDFWNRYYYYFKELLVEFFFFPTYLWLFRSRPRLRIFAATMAAACLGNVYFHALRDVEDLMAAGWDGALTLVGPRSFYAFLLALGIFVSMIREQERRRAATLPAAGRLAALRRIAGVWLFYSLIHIWGVAPGALTFAQRTAFFLSLFGLTG